MRIKRLIPNQQDIEKFADVNLQELLPLMDKYRGKRGNLIPLLQGAQNIFGYIPRDAFLMFNKELGINLSDMYGVATFYAQFRLAPVGKHIVKVCHGTACHVQNAPAITVALKEALKVDDGATTEDGLFTLESVACLGCCSLAPVMAIGDETFGKLTGKSAVKVIKDIRLKELN